MELQDTEKAPKQRNSTRDEQETGLSASRGGEKASGSLAVLVEDLSPKSLSKDWRGCCYF